MRRSLKTLITLAATATGLAACSPGTPASSGNAAGASGSQQTVTFRLWDEGAKPAYEASFAQFTKENPSINVKVEVVPWDKYWTQLPLDISAGQMADIYWVNSSNFAQYADAGNLMDISTTLGTDHDEWQKSIVDLYTRGGKLWGVPQIWDSIALFYNKDLLAKAGVDPANLTWVPDAGASGSASGSASADTLLPALKKLTMDEAGKHAGEAGFDPETIATYGMNAQADLQAIYRDFLAQNGADFQDEKDQFAFASPEGIAAFQYIIDLINKHHVAPPASETNTNGDFSRDQFVKGNMALFQSGPYNLKTIADTASIEWGLAPMIAGPKGRVSVVHGVVAVGNEQTKHREATTEVLKWLGSAKGQMPLAEQGIAFPGATQAQQAFVDFWAKKGVDVSVFIEAANGATAPAPRGPKVNAGQVAFTPTLLDTFLGNRPVADGVKAAQEAGNAAMK
ncbi:multiple sugar transport system substrate-binding protein [Arcanobacterium wilhelmae]|uniref:Multiple sugar transport system substrate-binding protein n=1 Tax=Arcanobacterium wilhelmae TaxID=1803177 RepID=A0ABT9NBB2_9ACTO|nr:sugar ABC transporter substrate-binding protein [Arcanobacterium wilhelmae]MDP9801009.1 multiple sugar transport system substrate-binding protein [Arcanobacterium wilhelmae]WFN90369.1 sugar ABC transporter substrate-binding protein [Arcanobacterium wilhelmae]